MSARTGAALPPRRRCARRCGSGAALVLLLSGLVAGCVPPRHAATGAGPAAEPTRSAPPTVPVVLVPGTTGTALADRTTGEIAWGRTGNLLRPRDGGYALALPIAAAPEGPAGAAREVPSPLEAAYVLGTLRLGPAAKPIYDPLLDALAAAGYRRGDLARPRPGDSLFAFAYDWRQSNVVGARRLIADLERLHRLRGGPHLQVDLVCQSSGAHLCRWLLRHGGASLAAAESGAGAPGWLRVRKLVLVGAPNGGSLRILREIDRGRRYVPLAGRRIRPEVLFTFRALFEDLPRAGEALLLDEAGEPLPAGDGDLYRAETWRRLGWSVFAPAAGERMRARPDLFGGEDERLAYLARRLGEAKRFHALLARDPSGAPVPRIYLVGNDQRPTPRRAVVVRRREGWATLFTGDRALRRLPAPAALAALAAAPGDGHATFESLLHLAPAERAAVVGDPFRVRGGHFEMIVHPATLSWIVERLREPAP